MTTEKLKAENERLKKHLNEWWRAASAIHNATTDEAEREAWGWFNSLRTGNGYSDAGDPVVEWLTKERDRLGAEVVRLRAELEAAKPKKCAHPTAKEWYDAVEDRR